MLQLIFLAVLALIGTRLSENDGVQIFRPPYPMFEVCIPFRTPQNRQCTNVGHLSTDFHNVKSNFVGFPVC